MTLKNLNYHKQFSRLAELYYRTEKISEHLIEARDAEKDYLFFILETTNREIKEIERTLERSAA